MQIADILQWTHAPDQESYVQSHRVRMLRTLETVPEGSLDKTILDMGSFMQMAPVCKVSLGYGQVYACYLGTGKRTASAFSREGAEFQCPMDYFDAEKDTFPYKDGFFDTVLCCEVLSHMQKDPMWMMHEINRITKFNGHLVLTVPNTNSIKAVWKVLNGFNPGCFSHYTISGEPRLAREYAAGELDELMIASGFQTVSVKGCNYALDFTDTDHHLLEHLKANDFPSVIREECLIMLARKVSAPQSRYPKWLYA